MTGNHRRLPGCLPDEQLAKDGNVVHFAVNRNPLALWRRALDGLLPQPCRFCAGLGEAGRACCSACAEALPWRRHGCARCALPLPNPADSLCGQCLKSPPPFTRTVAALHYRWPVDVLIKALKYQGRLADGRLLGTLLGHYLASTNAPRPELLLPVPLHDRRLRRRGFNQAQELSRALQRALDIPLCPETLARARDTDPQTGLSASARRRNLQGAFVCRWRPEARHVALIDDVVTTGATARAAARCLIRNGVERVDIWAVARAGD